MSELNYVVGDVTRPECDGLRILAHICNNLGKWGSGFTVSLSQRWEAPERLYRFWHRIGVHENVPFALGNVQFLHVGYNIERKEDWGLYVANMVAQRGLRSRDNLRPVCYESLRSCLEKVGQRAVELQAQVIMPKIGCDRGGGRWLDIEPMIQDAIVSKGVPVSVYLLKGEQPG